jgi:hypothetical protein
VPSTFPDVDGAPASEVPTRTPSIYHEEVVSLPHPEPTESLAVRVPAQEHQAPSLALEVLFPSAPGSSGSLDMTTSLASVRYYAIANLDNTNLMRQLRQAVEKEMRRRKPGVARFTVPPSGSVYMQPETVTLSDMHRFLMREHTMMNDNIMDALLQFVDRYTDQQKVYVLSHGHSFVLSQPDWLTKMYRFSWIKVSRYHEPSKFSSANAKIQPPSRKLFEEKDTLFLVAIHHPAHWTLGCIDFRTSIVWHIDSMVEGREGRLLKCKMVCSLSFSCCVWSLF